MANMTWIVHTDSRVRDFVADLIEDNEGSRTFIDSLSIYDLKRIKDGDVVYGTLQIGQMLVASANFDYYNIVPPKPDKNNWKAWHYRVRKFNPELEAEASQDESASTGAIFLIDNEEYEIGEDER